MIEYTENAHTGIVELMVDGKVTKEDFERISTQLETFLQAQGKIKLLEEVRNFKGFDPSVLFKGIRFDIEHIKDISHCAVVTDMGWVGPFARAAGNFINCEIRIFRGDEAQQARKWLTQA